MHRQVLVEANHRCAICEATEIDVHHIVDHAKVKEHKFENLIALCPNCHRRGHNGDIDRLSMLAYKKRCAERRSPAESNPEVLQALKDIQESNSNILETNRELVARVQALQREKAEAAEITRVSERNKALQTIQVSLQKLVPAQFNFDQGSAAFEKAHYREALQFWERSLELNSDWAINLNLAMLYGMLGRHADAAKRLGRAEKNWLKRHDYGNPAIPLMRGNAYLRREQYFDALAAYDEAQRLRTEQGLPPDPALAKNRGSVCYRLSRYDEALVAFSEAERLRTEQGLPPDPDLAMNRGSVYLSLSRYDEALAAYSESERLRKEQGLPPDPDLATNRGSVYLNLSRYDEALAAYSESERLRAEQGLPPDPGLAKNRGVVYDSLSRYDEALAAYDLSENLRRQQGLPEHPDITANRGNVYCKLGRQDEALAAFDLADKFRSEQGLPETPYLAVNRAEVYEALGDQAKAREFCQQARSGFAAFGGLEPPKVKAIIERICGKDDL
jgi:tetratricopeptide (TPR) repeat protein